MLNTAYGRMKRGVFEYAPAALDTGNGIKINPSEASYLAAGWRKVVDEPPAAKAGCVVMPSRWKMEGEVIVRVYKQVKTSATRIFSPFKIMVALAESGKWESISDWLRETEFGGVNGYELFIRANDFRDTDPFFKAVLAALKTRFGFTDAAVEEILAECVAD